MAGQKQAKTGLKCYLSGYRTNSHGDKNYHNTKTVKVFTIVSNVMCLAGAVANVADSGRCNPNVPSSISAGGKDIS